MTAPPNPKIILDERQRQAVEHVHGPMLVIAGAGTGKTTVLTQRAVNLIRENHARPGEVLALTYTEASAADMLRRVRDDLRGARIQHPAQSLQTVTFHAWCNELLRRRGAQFGVLDGKDLWIFLRRRIRELRLKHFVRAANVAQFLDSLLSFIDRCQDELITAADYAAYVERLERGEIPLPRVAESKKQAKLEDSEILERCHEIAQVFETVERMLREENLGTFGHMITRAHELLKKDSALLEEERGRSRFLLIDEFQDANFAQVEILSMLAGKEANVFAVGDPDQAIYQFRGASSEAFTLFAKKFPAAQVVVLGKNRRSLHPILQCAFGVINDNPPVFPREGSAISYRRAALESLRSEEASHNADAAPAPLVEIVTWPENDVEAADLAHRIQKLRRAERCQWGEFAVLFRSHSHREELVREFSERGIPFSIEGLDVLQTPEVRDALACFTAAVSPNDAASLFRVAALPQFQIDPVELRSAMQAAGRRDLDLRKVLEKVQRGSAVLASVAKAHSEVEKEAARADHSLQFVIRHFALPPSAMLSALVRFVDAWHRKAITETGGPSEFLEYLDYFVQARGSISLPASAEDAVQLLTAHAAKGLEFRHVAVIRGSSTWFPVNFREALIAFPAELRRSGAGLANDRILHAEEERRLFYVAMTRARDTLAIYANKGRGKKDPKPTKFLREFMEVPQCKKFWSTRPAAAVQDSLFAEEEDRVALQKSPVATWLLLPPTANFVTRLSPSSITIYEQCPLRFKLERDWNLPREGSASLHYGTAIHNVLRTFYDAQRFERPIADGDLLEQFRSYLAQAGIADRYQYDLYLRQGTEQLRQFLGAARGALAPDIIDTEKTFEMLVGAAQLEGRIDRVDHIDDDTVAIVDYKTGKAQSQEDADESLQLSLYALAAREVWGKRADRLIFYNLENNTPIITTRTNAKLDEVKARVEKASRDIAEGRFAPKPGFQCAFCPYWNLCPATEKVVRLPGRKSSRT